MRQSDGVPGFVTGQGGRGSLGIELHVVLVALKVRCRVVAPGVADEGSAKRTLTVDNVGFSRTCLRRRSSVRYIKVRGIILIIQRITDIELTLVRY